MANTVNPDEQFPLDLPLFVKVSGLVYRTEKVNCYMKKMADRYLNSWFHLPSHYSHFLCHISAVLECISEHEDT